MSGKCDEPSKDLTTTSTEPDRVKVEEKDVARFAAVYQPVDAEDMSSLHKMICPPTSTSLERADTVRVRDKASDERRIQLARMEK